MSQGTGDPTTVEFRATGLNVDGAISAAVSIAVIYVVTWFLVLGYFNDFWYSFIFPTKVNSATIKEKKERSEKDLNLNKLVKLGTAPTNSVEIEKAPETRAAYAVLSQDQIQQRMQVERQKAIDKESPRRISQFFEMPAFKRSAGAIEKKEPKGPPPPELTSPSHIKRTHVFLSTPVAPPAPSEHLKTFDEEKENDAWEEFFSKEHELPYWVNDITKESTWVEPGPVKFKRLANEGDIDQQHWKQCWSASFQRPYWHNTSTGENTWRDPFKYIKAKKIDNKV